jgi:hypothetical protein
MNKFLTLSLAFLLAVIISCSGAIVVMYLIINTTYLDAVIDFVDKLLL